MLYIDDIIHCDILPYTSHGRAVIRLTETFHFDAICGCSRFYLGIPAGFVSDGASIPRFFHRLLPPAEFAREALIHDYLYAVCWPRIMADATMYQVMVELGRPAWKRDAIFLGVRGFGWKAWNEHHRRIEESSCT